MKYDDRPGMARDLVNGRPFNRYMPTRFLLDLYSDDDARYEGSFQQAWYANAATRPVGMAWAIPRCIVPEKKFLMLLKLPAST